MTSAVSSADRARPPPGPAGRAGESLVHLLWLNAGLRCDGPARISGLPGDQVAALAADDVEARAFACAGVRAWPESGGAVAPPVTKRLPCAPLSRGDISA
ncbi:hypothetical protein [Streptomyces sp. NPDC007100]|uniref:hypothetical protein n=1 Tax=unclassified Streptomyces TaxID=2593676 RepID=UPI0033EB9BCE